MTQSYLRFARYVTSLPASAAMTSRRCSSNYGNSRLTRHGSTFAIRRVASSRPKTYHPPQPMHPPDVVDLLQGRWPGHFVCPEGRYVQGDADTGTERRAGIFIGPEFGAVFRPGLVAAAGERMNTDLHMSGDLTNRARVRRRLPSWSGRRRWRSARATCSSSSASPKSRSSPPRTTVPRLATSTSTGWACSIPTSAKSAATAPTASPAGSSTPTTTRRAAASATTGVADAVVRALQRQ